MTATYSCKTNSPTRLLFCKWRPVQEVQSFLCVTWPPAGPEEFRSSLQKFLCCCVGSLTVKMLPEALTVLLTVFSLTESKQKDFYTFKVVNSRGKLVSLEKYRDSVSLGLTNIYIVFTVTGLSACHLHEWMLHVYLLPLSIVLADVTNSAAAGQFDRSLLGMSHHVAPLAYVATGLQSSCRAPAASCSFHSIQVQISRPD